MGKGNGTMILLLFCIIFMQLSNNIVFSTSDIGKISVLNSKANEHVGNNFKEKMMNHFYENIGQHADNQVKYYGYILGGMIAFCNEMIYYQSIEGDDIILSFPESHSVIPKSIGMLSYRTHYFLGIRGTYTGVRAFEYVLYENLWEGINLLVQSTSGGERFEFQLTPDADPHDIRVRCDGFDNSLVRETSMFVRNRLMISSGAQQKIIQNELRINTGFTAYGPKTFGFQISNLTRLRDYSFNCLQYSTFVGGSDYDHGDAIAVDTSGNAFIAGETDSLDFPIINAYDDSTDGYYDLFIFKINASGNRLEYSTFIGGSHRERMDSIAIDSEGAAYVCGYTESLDFPTANAYDDSHNGNGDCFVLKLNATGDGLIYSTYIGGSDFDWGHSIVIDSEKAAYICGYTRSLDFPTANAYDDSHNGNGDCFVLKLNATGDGPIYSTYIGGMLEERGYSIVIDSAENVFVTGYTESIDFPTVDAYSTQNSGDRDCFIFKLNEVGNLLLYSSYVGGSSRDEGHSIAVDSSGNTYISGYTESLDFPTVISNSSYNGGSLDALVFKLNSTGNGLLFSTYIGGSSEDKARCIAIDISGNAYITGDTNSSDFPVEKAHDFTHNGEFDCYITILNTSDGTLFYSSFFGGSENDYSNSIALDVFGDLYMTGQTGSIDFPISNAFNEIHQGGFADCLVLKIPLKDSDSDGLVDFEENLIETDPFNQDTDYDTLSDYDEVFIHNTNPLTNDSDHDGMPDNWEIEHGLNPLVNDANDDPDLDNLLNLDEYLNGIDPHNEDSDGDGIPDGWEVTYGYNPADPVMDLSQILVYNSPILLLLGGLITVIVTLYYFKPHLEMHYRKKWAMKDRDEIQKAIEELEDTTEDINKTENEFQESDS